MSRLQTIGKSLVLIALVFFGVLPFLGSYELTESVFERVVSDADHREALRPEFESDFDRVFDSQCALVHWIDANVESVNQAFRSRQEWDRVIYSDYAFELVKGSALGFQVDNAQSLFVLLMLLVTVGSGLIILPQFVTLGSPGVKNDHVFHQSYRSRGLYGMVLAAFLIVFYVLIYWFPAYVVNWVLLVDGLSLSMSGEPASKWFLYGFLYTLVVLVMGVRMLIHYRHSAYHKVRTLSVMFFQLGFAFALPSLLGSMNLPVHDLKNIWPLDYSFFFDYRLDAIASAGTIGYFMLGWGIALFAIGVPLFTYLYGKRWYCSWVCGCGGLAETAGDPFRHLSSKKLAAWKLERWMVHAVLVFAVIMTIAVVYTYVSGNADLINFGGLAISSFDVRGWYGFLIGSAFAGVIGTGFYPLLGNRVWCRFGCPLAAYIGIIQRFKSRFRITTNGGQCISCGNCSTYCEMGIDVRAYAQRGQNIVRSSCVGCGICASVCPRGVLKLENGTDTGAARTEVQPIVFGNDGARLNL